MSAGPFELDRKLAAILAADVVGFSRMMGADERGTLARLDAARREVIDPILTAHRGRIFKVMGDGLLVEFPSVVLALRAAVAVQTRLPDHNDMAPGPRIVLRIGVHQGDVVVQGSDLLGDGVNIAARLEALAEPGGICISARVHEDAAGKIALAARDGGERTLKNIAQPIRIFLINPASVPDTGISVLGDPSRTALAVLPFTGTGGEAAVALASHITAVLPPALSHVYGLMVVSAPPSTDGWDARQVAYALGTPNVLHGTVRQVGERVQVTAGLLEAATGQLLWSDRREADAQELDTLGSRFPDQVAAAVGLRLHKVATLPEQTADEVTMITAPSSAQHSLTLMETSLGGPPAGYTVVLAQAGLTLGRQASNDLVLPGGEVSRTHCRIELVGTVAMVTDLHSTNGTFVDDRRIEATTRLHPNALVKVGPYVMRYSFEEPTAIDNSEATRIIRRTM